MTGSILIIDDNPDNIHLLATALQDEGYNVRSSPSASHALKSIDIIKPDIILLDILMPGIDGYELCKKLKKNNETEDIPVLFLSALNEVENKLKAFKLGGVDYITKPFNIEEVIQRVKIHLKLHENIKNIKKNKKYEKSVLTDLQKKTLLSKIISLMQNEQPYLDTEFNIDQLAEAIGSTKHIVSEVINQQLGKNYNLFVNEYRVYHIIKLMSQGKSKTMTLLGLAHESGFNSKSTFNIVFKKVMNMSPRQYLKSIEIEME